MQRTHRGKHTRRRWTRVSGSRPTVLRQATLRVHAQTRPPRRSSSRRPQRSSGTSRRRARSTPRASSCACRYPPSTLQSGASRRSRQGWVTCSQAASTVRIGGGGGGGRRRRRRHSAGSVRSAGRRAEWRTGEVGAVGGVEGLLSQTPRPAGLGVLPRPAGCHLPAQEGSAEASSVTATRLIVYLPLTHTESQQGQLTSYLCHRRSLGRAFLCRRWEPSGNN